MSILVCFALKEEAAPFRKMVTSRSASKQIDILIVGIGRHNAEESICEFLIDEAKTPPDLVFTCGFAGGLNPDLKLGNVVFEIPSADKANDGIIDADHRKKLIEAGAKPATFFCANRIATTVAEKKLLREQTDADVVEMESGAIQLICQKHGIPCITVRVISDTAGEDLPLDFNAMSKPDQSLDFGKLAWTIAKSPGKIGALMQLQKKTSFAAEQLAAVLGEII